MVKVIFLLAVPWEFLLCLPMIAMTKKLNWFYLSWVFFLWSDLFFDSVFDKDMCMAWHNGPIVYDNVFDNDMAWHNGPCILLKEYTGNV